MIEFDWDAYYSKLIRGGMSHQQAIRWSKIADIKAAIEMETHPAELEKLERKLEQASVNA